MSTDPIIGLPHGASGMAGDRGPDLLIADWEFLHAEQMLNVYLGRMTKAGDAISAILNQVGGAAVSDGAAGIAAGCQKLSEPVQNVTQSLSSIQAHLQGSATDFITEVDQLDKFVY